MPEPVWDRPTEEFPVSSVPSRKWVQWLQITDSIARTTPSVRRETDQKEGESPHAPRPSDPCRPGFR